ncbi:hypothetical protein KEM52_001663 [Ascosphaera acerosa]|nr:hypothetical protein KEM52_001663 [Ascosphaera acerosa]
MGELEPWIDDHFIRQLWYGMGEQVNVKMIRDRFSGSNAGYCFVDFASPAAAAKALTLNGQPIPNTSRQFKLNWASGGGLSDRRDDRGPEYSIFVGDLGPEVNDYSLVSLFQNRFPSVKSAKIMTDNITGMSRGYGFVRFSDETDQQRALTEMQGVYCLLLAERASRHRGVVFPGDDGLLNLLALVVPPGRPVPRLRLSGEPGELAGESAEAFLQPRNFQEGLGDGGLTSGGEGGGEVAVCS